MGYRRESPLDFLLFQVWSTERVLTRRLLFPWVVWFQRRHG